MCDEYQDSNQVQETLLTSISREADGHPNIFVVGDVKQSIYRFRLAEPGIFLNKYDYTQLNKQPNETYVLQENKLYLYGHGEEDELLADGVEKIYYKTILFCI